MAARHAAAFSFRSTDELRLEDPAAVCAAEHLPHGDVDLPVSESVLTEATDAGSAVHTFWSDGDWLRAGGRGPAQPALQRDLIDRRLRLAGVLVRDAGR